MQGFVVEDGELLEPPVQVEPETRTRLSRVLAAIIAGATPEEVSGYLTDDGFPPEVEETLERPYEADELGAHVDILLAAIQMNGLAAAA